MILALGDRPFGEFRDAEDSRVRRQFQTFFEGAGDEPGFETVAPEQGMLGQGYALDGEEFLRVDGLINGDEVGAELGDLVDILDADGGESFGLKAIFTGHANLFARGASGLARGMAGNAGNKGNLSQSFL
jgi:hypothetical protein